MDELKKENEKLKQQIKEADEKLDKMREHLDKYTKPTRNKRFYENHKDEIKALNSEYRKTVSKEKIKEYNKRAYERRKAKLLQKSDL